MKARDVLQRMNAADESVQKGIPTLKLETRPRKIRRNQGSARTFKLDYDDPYHSEPYNPVKV